MASLNLGYTLLGATRLSVETTRDLSYSYEISEPYYISTGLGGTIRRQVHGDLDAVLSARRTRQNYRTLATVTTAPRLDTIQNYSADLGARLTREVRLGFVVGWQRRESTAGATQAYHGVTAGFSLTYGS